MLDVNIDKPLAFSAPQPPKGMPVADPKFHKPLMKLIKMRMKPVRRQMRKPKTKYKKTDRYY